MSSPQSARPISILLIEPHGGLALKLQEMLIAHFQAALDLGTARSLREGMAHLCTHQIALVLMDLMLPDYKGLDAVRALRLTAPAAALVVLSATPSEPLLLDAIRAGAHEALTVPTPSSQDLRLTIERALVRAELPVARATSTSSVQQAALPPALPKLAHDLNNAITSINGFADILLARLPAEEPARASAEQIRKAGTRAASLVKALVPAPASAPPVLMSDPAITAQAA